MKQVENTQTGIIIGDRSELLVQTVKSPPVNNFVNYWFGLIMMMLNKIRHSVAGYTSTRGFSDDEIDKAVDHSWNIVKRYYSYLNAYDPSLSDAHFRGKRILELGIGSDMGTAVIGSVLGAKDYIGFDVFTLAEDAEDSIYDGILQKLEKHNCAHSTIRDVQKNLKHWQTGESSAIRYIVDPTFQLDQHGLKDIDYVVSNAAVQQFLDVDRTVSEMNKIMRPGGKFISLIDLSTHTRWIGLRDPFNLYRYPNWLYRLLKFKGSPNRLRSEDYREIFQKHGWTNIKIYDRISADQNYIKAIKSSFSEPFSTESRNMNALTVIVCATKA